MPRWTELPRRFLRQPAERRGLFVEACFYLVAARVMLLLLSFSQLTRFFNRSSSKERVLANSERARLRGDVRWAITRAAEYLPGDTVCFPRGIAAQAMLRRRGSNATLYYGAATMPQKGLTAHVWVMDGAEGVVGHQIAGDYRVIAHFPS
jgi:hypothetical protein